MIPNFDRSKLPAATPLADAVTAPTLHGWKFPYTVMIRLNEDGDYIVRSPELKGCIAHGETIHEALTRFQEVYQLWTELREEGGLPTPVPLTEDEFFDRPVKRPVGADSLAGNAARRQGDDYNGELAPQTAQSHPEGTKGEA